MKLKKQLHVGFVDPSIKVEEPLTYHMQNKARGGLFTSSFVDEKYGSEWIQWCIGNEFNIPENGLWKGSLITVNSNAKIYVVDSVEDMNYLFDNYGFHPHDELQHDSMYSISYEKVSQDYDAVHLTSKGQVVTRHPYMFDRTHFDPSKMFRTFNGWDCESTHFFRNVFDDVEPIELKIIDDE